jgi:hypothetical protein
MYQEMISDQRRQHVLGVYSSPLKAWQIFLQRLQKNRAPYTGGVFRYANNETFSMALREASRPSILIYEHSQFNIFIQWNVLDQPLP